MVFTLVHFALMDDSEIDTLLTDPHKSFSWHEIKTDPIYYLVSGILLLLSINLFPQNKHNLFFNSDNNNKKSYWAPNSHTKTVSEGSGDTENCLKIQD